MLELAGDEFGLLPGPGFGGDAKSFWMAGEPAANPLGAAASAIEGIVFLRALGAVASVDAEHNAANLAPKVAWYNMGTFSLLLTFSTR